MAKKPELQTFTPVREIHTYSEVETTHRDLADQKRVWRRKTVKYEFEGLARREFERIERASIGRLFAQESRSCGPRSPDDSSEWTTLEECSDGALWWFIENEARVTRRARVLEELLRRKDPRLPAFVADELARDDLRPTWRNALIFATEHLHFNERSDRARLRDRLLRFAVTINNEWHPRSRHAQAASLRRYLSLVDDQTELGELRGFLSSEFPVRVRRLACLGIQNAFAEAPPSEQIVNVLEPLCEELREMTKYLVRRNALTTAEEDFYLGLDALEALIRLSDPASVELLLRAKTVGRRWVVRQLRKFLVHTNERWAIRDPGGNSLWSVTLRDGLDVLDSGER